MEYQVVEESALVGLKSFLLNPVDGRVRVWSQRNTTFQLEHIVGLPVCGLALPSIKIGRLANG
jgi:hypothetical protein